MPEDIDIQQIKELVRLVEINKLAELTVEENGVTITVKGPVPTEARPVAEQIYTTQSYEQVELLEPVTGEPEAPIEPEQDNLVRLESPMVGVFYRSASPDSPSFVEVGDVIEAGQTIGLIEAMKVFSEIPSEFAGEVVEIPSENGKLVQQGQVLIVLRPSS